MLATIIHAPRDIRVETVPDPVLSTGGDAIVKVVAACVCGSDLWPYRGVTPTHEPHRIGHEFVGVVEAVGDAVQRIAVGDFVIAPFYVCDNTCINCRNGVSHIVPARRLVGRRGSHRRIRRRRPGRARARSARRRHPGARCRGPSPTIRCPGLLTLSDVMGTGHHAAVSAGVGPGDSVAVVGDGAVGPVRDHRRATARGDDDHRDVAASAATGTRPRLRRDAPRRRARQRRGDRRAGDHRRHRRRPRARVRGLEGVDGPGDPLDPPRRHGRVRRSAERRARAARAAALQPQRRGERRRRAGARLHRGAAARRALGSDRGRAACSTSSCRCARPRRPTPPWTSVVRSRCCCGHERAVGATRRRGVRAAVLAVHARGRVGARRSAARRGRLGGASGRDRDLAGPAAGVPHCTAGLVGRQRRLA